MKIAFLVSRFPYPLEKGDKLRAFHQIKSLAKEHEITLFALSEKEIKQEWLAELQKYCKNVHLYKLSKIGLFWALFKGLFSKKPFQVHYFYRKNIKRQISQHIKKEGFDVVYCQLIRMSEYVKNVSTPKVLDYMDALSKGIEKRIDKVPFYQKPFFKEEFKRLNWYENIIFDYFDEHTIISGLDRQSIFHEKQNEIKIIPNGIDTTFFEKTPSTLPKYDLLFTGNMSYAPNVDACQYLAESILLGKNYKVMLAGADPLPIVKDLQNEKVTVSGWIDDIRDAYNDAKIFIAPMRIGTGVQNKILEAMAMELPCIISSYTHKSLNAIHGEHLFVCTTKEEYIEVISKLLKDSTLRENIGKAGREFVQKNYDWSQSSNKMTTLFKTLV